MEPNKQTWFKKISNSLFLSIVFTMVIYWILINVALIITAIININHWLLVVGFNIGFLSNIISLTFLFLASKWLTSKKPFNQTLAYCGFLVRMLLYGSIIVLVIFFNFANIITTIVGMSISIVATITASLCLYQKNKKAKEGI